MAHNSHHLSASTHQQRLIDHRRQLSKHQQEYSARLLDEGCRDIRKNYKSRQRSNNSFKNTQRSPKMEFQDPPLQLESSLNDSLGWNIHDDDDGDLFNLDEEFERIYSGNKHDDDVFGGENRSLSRERGEVDIKPWQSKHRQQQQQSEQKEQRIHRTSFSYSQPSSNTPSPVNRRQFAEEEETNFSMGLNPYEFNKEPSNSADKSSSQAANRESIFRGASNNKLYQLPSPQSVSNRHYNTSAKPSNVVTPSASMFTTSTAPTTTYSTTNNNKSSYASQFNPPSSPPKGILRNPTALSSFTQTTLSHHSLSRNRSSSRPRNSGRSSSRSRSRGRQSPQDDYHESLFRGAQLIKEQLIMGMADVEQRKAEVNDNKVSSGGASSNGRGVGGFGQQFACGQFGKSIGHVNTTEDNDEFDAKFDHGPFSCGQSSNNTTGAKSDLKRHMTVQHNNNDDAIDFDYSRQNLPAVNRTNNNINSSQLHDRSARRERIEVIKASSSNVTDPSSISSRLETESQRLDNLVKIFAQSSSVCSSQSNLMNPSPSGDQDVQQQQQQQQSRQLPQSQQFQTEAQAQEPKSSNALNQDYEMMQFLQEKLPWEDEQQEDGDEGTLKGDSVASPTSTCVDLNKDAGVEQVPSRDESAAGGNGYAQQYFQDNGSTSKTSNNSHSNNNSNPIHTDSPIITQPKQIPPSQSNLQAQYQEHKKLRLEKAATDALTHARNAGSLWRSLVGNHVRFPSAWDDILPPSAPVIDRPNLKWSKWYYPARHRVKGDRKLNSREYGVRTRRSGGRILMNILVREMHSPHVCREVSIGCFHPNAKGIRIGDPCQEVEDVREVWMGVRWVIPTHCNEPELNSTYEEGDVECFIDGFLTQRRSVDSQMGSPLGHRKAVNNENVRAVFGDQPPLTTVNLYEDELAEIVKANDAKKLSSLPGLMLLKLFLFSK